MGSERARLRGKPLLLRIGEGQQYAFKIFLGSNGRQFLLTGGVAKKKGGLRIGRDAMGSIKP